jgi:hypothetical protein
VNGHICGFVCFKGARFHVFMNERAGAAGLRLKNNLLAFENLPA